MRVAQNREDGVTLKQIAADFGIHPMTLQKWIRKADVEAGIKPGTTAAASQEVKAGGGKISFRGDADCAYRPVTAYLRALSFRNHFPEATPEALRAMVNAALAGIWLGQRHGDDLWGSNLYLQTVSAVLDVPMPWELAHAAVEARLVSLDGAVLGLPQPIRTAPVGPIMDWDSTEPTDSDWVVWWSRLDGRFQVEVIRDPGNTSGATLTVYDHSDDDAVVHTLQVGLAYGAVFGPDVDDVRTWREICSAVTRDPG